MRDFRLQELASNLINYSVKLQKGEKMLIENLGSFEQDFVIALIEEAYKAGGQPFVSVKDARVERVLRNGATVDHFQKMANYEAAIFGEMDAYISLTSGTNVNELSDVSGERNQIFKQTVVKAIHQNLENTRWVVIRFPSNSMAQLAKMSTEAFEDFYFKVSNVDYRKMGYAMENLVTLMNHTDRVHIIGPGTDLTFSIKDIPAVKCYGIRNIPDGEVYSAPVRDSVNGILSYNCASIHNGFTFENIVFKFKDGKIVEATANDSKRLNKVLDTDEGARYIGEFAIGLNPHILSPMLDTLFDEKIAGSFHFTPGTCYSGASNGNQSVIHWDLVSIQRPEWGGGEIWFDDVLIRKDGRFTLPTLECLNPENLR